MFISCPKCSTSYAIDGRNIDKNGRAVRCFKCGEVWHQNPVPVHLTQNLEPKGQLQDPGIEQRAPETPNSNSQYFGPGYLPPNIDPGSAIPYPPYYPPPPNTEPGAIAPYPPYPPYHPYYPVQMPPQALQNTGQENSANAISEGAKSDSESGSNGVPAVSQDEPSIQSESVAATSSSSVSEDRTDLPTDEELAEALGDDDAIKPIESATSQPREDLPELSEEELENLGDPDPIGGASSQESIELEDPNMDPEDLPDPDPLPGGGEELDDGEKKRSFKGIIISIIIVLILGSIVAGLIVMRHTIAGVWPGANGLLYDWVGLRVPQPGDGLEISLRSPQRKTEGGKDIIIFDVVIQNTTEETQRVPTVISSLADTEGNLVQETTTTPSKPTLDAGKVLRFKVQFPDAPAAAKQSFAKWGAYPKGGDKEQ